LGTYPCSNCGATADTSTGCPNCGRSVQEEITELSKVITQMQFRNRDMVEERTLLLRRIQGAIATRTLLQESAAANRRPYQRAASPSEAAPPPPDPKTQTGTARSRHGRTPRQRAAPVPPLDRTNTVTGRPIRPGRQVRMPKPTTPQGHPPETSTRTTQNALLWLGGLLFAVTGSGYLMRQLSDGPRVAVFTVLAAVLLALPLWIAKRQLTSTAETLASLGLLFVLLDGYALWGTGGPARLGIPRDVFAGIVCLVAAAIAAGYRAISRLVAPRFAMVLLLQPVVPLLLASSLHGTPGLAVIFATVAVLDLALSLALLTWLYRGDLSRLPAAPPLRLRWGGDTGDAEAHAAEGTPYLRDAVWALHGLAVLAALACAAVTLAEARTGNAALAGAAALLVAAVAGMAGGLILTRPPLPDIGTGLAVSAIIFASGRVGAVLLPGWGLAVTAAAVLVVGLAVPALGGLARQGPRLAGAAWAAGLGIVLLGHGLDAIIAPLRAASPPWHADLGKYGATVDRLAGPSAAQLVLAAIVLTGAALAMLPARYRTDGMVGGLTLASVLVPAGLRMPWAAVPALLVAIAVPVGAAALVAKRSLSCWVRIAAAAVIGGYAAGVSLARYDVAALTLTALAIAGAGIGTAPKLVESTLGPYAGRAADAGWGAAGFALPGAIAFATAGTTNGSNPVPVLAATFLTVAGTLTATAIAQVARGRPSPLMVSGTTAGAGVTAVAAAVTPGVAMVDLGVAVLLLVGALTLTLAPWLDLDRITTRADGLDLSAAAVTAAAIVAVARVGGLVAPRYQLAIAATLVLIMAVGVRAMPREWRHGPVLGGSLVGVVIAVFAGIDAVRSGLAAVDAVRPVWHTDLAHWTAAVPGLPGPQLPIALLLLAGARVALDGGAKYIVSSVCLGLALLAVPTAFGLPWWSPVAFSGLGAAVLGILAALSVTADAGFARYGMATVLFADTIGTSLVRPAITGQTLVASTVILGALAWTAARTLRRHEEVGHPLLIGGSALTTALLTLPAGVACLARAQGGSWAFALTAALAGACLGLALTALVSYNSEALLPWATAGVAIAGTGVAVGTAVTGQPMAVYAAAAALLAVLAELLRAAVVQRRATLSGAGLRRRAVTFAPSHPGYTLMLAAAPATVLATVALGPSLGATLFGPYRQAEHIWPAHPPTSTVDALGNLSGWVGDAESVAAALLLTLAAALAAVGFGGDRSTIIGRAVAVVVPGTAITLLIAPAALHAGWPAGTVAALLVAVLTGLAVALTASPPETIAGAPLRYARILVGVIWLLASAAAMTGSLATQSMTIWALATAMAAGLVAALVGGSRPARIIGWLVTAAAGHLLALVVGLITGLPVYWSAFLVAAVAGGLLVLASLLPRLRRADAVSEAVTVEASAYAGAVLALVLASRSLPHLSVFACAWGVVLSIAATRPNRPQLYRTGLILFATGHEVLAWWLLMHVAKVALPEAYTLAVALAALIIGYLQTRRHPEVSSWASYGVALAAALIPSLVIVLATGETPLRRGLLIVAAAGVLVAGSLLRLQAPVVVGGVTLSVAALHELAVVSTTALLWTVIALVGAALIGLGANYEKRRRELQRLRGALGRLR
jgi:hypothetical protein